MSNITIKRVGITEKKEDTWGRVYVDFVENGEDKYVFKNWFRGKPKTFVGDGSFENEQSYTWADTKVIVDDFEDVLDGLKDRMFLADERYRNLGGIPSKILRQVIQDLDAGLARDVGERRGWYKK